jgi:hypothetical protein
VKRTEVCPNASLSAIVRDWLFGFGRAGAAAEPGTSAPSNPGMDWPQRPGACVRENCENKVAAVRNLTRYAVFPLFVHPGQSVFIKVGDARYSWKGLSVNRSSGNARACIIEPLYYHNDSINRATVRVSTFVPGRISVQARIGPVR